MSMRADLTNSANLTKFADLASNRYDNIERIKSMLKWSYGIVYNDDGYVDCEIRPNKDARFQPVRIYLDIEKEHNKLIELLTQELMLPCVTYSFRVKNYRYEPIEKIILCQR